MLIPQILLSIKGDIRILFVGPFVKDFVNPREDKNNITIILHNVHEWKIKEVLVIWKSVKGPPLFTKSNLSMIYTDAICGPSIIKIKPTCKELIDTMNRDLDFIFNYFIL